jgi:long-chain acyl-CoA synthetase
LAKGKSLLEHGSQTYVDEVGSGVYRFGLDDAVAQHAATAPDAVATACQGTELTWRETHDRCVALAGVLRGAGVTPGDRVLWWGQNCHRMLEALFAAARIGAVLCPVNWRLSVGELEFVLDDCAPRVVLWQEQEIGATIAGLRDRAKDAVWIQHDGVGAEGYEARVRLVEDESAYTADLGIGAPVLMMYTAAFDARPAGALLSQRALTVQSMILRLQERLDASTVYLNSGPMFHVGSLRRAIAVAHAGGRNIMCRRVNAVELCTLIDRYRCTHAFLQPPTMAQLVEANADRRFDLSSLRSSSGPPGWAEMVTVVADSDRVASGYGQTELAGVVTYRYPDAPGIGARPGPLARVEVHDADGIPVAPGESGEIVVRGPMVTNGYHNRPELNRMRFRNGWHHTNDIGRLEVDGSISFVGPLQRMIKSAAENVYPVEVETVLVQHPAITQAAVLGVPDEMWGQRVKAVVVATTPVTAAELNDFCRARLAGYKCPRLYDFATSLPTTPAGVDRDAVDVAYGGGGYPGDSTQKEKL